MSLLELAKKLTTITIGERPFTYKEALAKKKQQERAQAKNIPFIDKRNKTVTIPMAHITEDQLEHLEDIQAAQIYQQVASRQKKQLSPERKINRPVKNGNAQGWFVVGGKKIYARSDWERKYAFYLECSRGVQSIIDWEHEPETFWFEGIKRGTRSYTPDFWLPSKGQYHEVKGWMDPKSQTKLDRMKRYFPEVKIIVIGADWFRAAERQGLCSLIPGWECKHTERKRPPAWRLTTET